MLLPILIAHRFVLWVLRSISAGRKCKVILMKTLRTEAVEKVHASIRGLTILDKELFVVNGESSEVEVYDSAKFNFVRLWDLKELTNPWDLASCKRNRCLYIFDYKNRGQSNEILRVNPSGKLIKNWSTGGDWGEGLSVTDEANVILTVYDRNKLNEYSPDGQLLREINLSSDAGIRHPLHAVRLASGQFVVSHGDVGDELHRVCVIGTDGRIKETFGGYRGSDIGLLSRPVHLTVYGKNGLVMVADRGNGRILLLDSDLKYREEIHSTGGKQTLGEPWRIHLDDSIGRLLVADNSWNDQKILIYNLK